MMPESKNEQGFLSRWSARKREAALDDHEADESEIVAENAMLEEAIEPAQEGEIALSPEELELEQNKLAAEQVDLETLNYSSDFGVFMKRGVSDAVKNAAMQKLWRSNPVLAVLDGLNDYDQDFADPKLNVYKSIWKVGTGFLTEAEANHTPVDKVMAALDKFAETKPKEELEVEPIEDTTAEAADVPAELVDASAPEEVLMAMDTAPMEEEEVIEPPQPQRVSLRRRIFEDTE